MSTFQDTDYEEVDVPGRFDWQRWLNALVGLAIVVVCFLAGFLLNQRTSKPTGAAVTPVQPAVQTWPTAQILTSTTMPTVTPKPYQAAQQPVISLPGQAEFVGFMVNDQVMTCDQIRSNAAVWQALSDRNRSICGGQ